MSNSFVLAAAERLADASLLQEVTQSSASSFEPWASALNAIAAFDTEASAARTAVDTASVAALEERLACAEVVDAVEAAVAAAFDARVQAACEAALAAVIAAVMAQLYMPAAKDAWERLLSDERLAHFTRTVGRIPDGVLKKRNLDALRGFVESRAKASS